MIRYDLTCAKGHSFDGWFQSASAYDKLRAGGLVACTICGETQVDKALMAPRLSGGAKPPEAVAPPPAPDPRRAAYEEMVTRMRDHVEQNATWVGGSFAREARAQHLGEAPERPIYGEAKPDEARALIEDGVPVAPLPFTPRQKAN